MTILKSQKVIIYTDNDIYCHKKQYISDDTKMCHLYLLRRICCDDPCDDKMASLNSLGDEN